MDDMDYKILLDLHEYRNITKVAQINFVSQPAITKRIKRIEQELKCKLIHSSKKGVLFTAAGENIIPYCRNILRQVQSLRHSMNEMQGVIGGSINVISSPNYCRFRLPSAIKLYSQRYPMVDINIITVTKSNEVYYKLLEHEDYIGIIRGETNWAGESILLASEPVCLICSHKNANRPLNEYKYIRRNTDSNMSAQISKWAKENNISLHNTSLCLDDISTCKKVVQSGIGWCILPSICLDDFDGKIEKLSFSDGTPFVRNTYALFHNTYYKLPQVKLFIDTLIENEKNYSLD